MRTRQELFNLAWNGLKAQGFVQSLEAGGCAYRGDGGRRCAIGHCIPDELYNPSFEGCVIQPAVCDAAGIERQDARFAEELQEAHDEASCPKNMESRLRELATVFGLAVPS